MSCPEEFLPGEPSAETNLILTAVMDMVETANAHGIKPDDHIAQFAAPLTHE